MEPNSNSAASKTLPLGTRERVTNLNNGKSAVVVIKDRGPHVKGRIVDLSPATAKAIGADKLGVIPVGVTPIEAPQSGRKSKPETAAGNRPGM
ncbi:MAG: septal ring lytic transglycosylase RlpA family protein [Polaromonas sp.]